MTVVVVAVVVVVVKVEKTVIKVADLFSEAVMVMIKMASLHAER